MKCIRGLCLLVCLAVLGIAITSSPNDDHDGDDNESSFQQNFPPTICVSWNSSSCPGQDNALTTTQVMLHYNYTWENGDSGSLYDQTISKECGTTAIYQLMYSREYNSDTSVPQSATYFFEQQEHGGRTCNCLVIYFDNNCTNTSRKFSLCDGNASHPRRLQVQWKSSNILENISDVPIHDKELPFSLSCNNEIPNIEVSFLSRFQLTCSQRNRIPDVGVEISIRLSSMPEEWIPIQYQYSTNKLTDGATNIRGYEVKEYKVNDNKLTTITICNISLDNSVQFRWLQNHVNPLTDTWILDDISIKVKGNTVLMDKFDGDINENLWPRNHLRNVMWRTVCGKDGGLYFGAQMPESTLSRVLLTNSFKLSEFSSQFESSSKFNSITCTTHTSVVSSQDLFESSSTLSPSSTSLVSDRLGNIFDSINTSFTSSIEAVENTLSPISTMNDTENNSDTFISPTSSDLQMNLIDTFSSELYPTSTQQESGTDYYTYYEEVPSQHNFPPTICVSWSSSSCPGQDNALTSTHVLLNYDYAWDDNVSYTLYDPNLSKHCGMTAIYQLSYPRENDFNTSVSQSATYLFEQPEHGGGTCNCVQIFFDTNCTDISRKFSLCGGFASYHRRLQVQWNSSNILQEVDADSIEKDLPFNLVCNNSLPFLEVSFLSRFELTCSERINKSDEGVVFSIRLSSMPDEWIPLQYQYYINNKLIRETKRRIRGYEVKVHRVNNDTQTSIRICNLNFSDSVQFRWQQNHVLPSEDTWILENLQISFNGTTLLTDNFKTTSLNMTLWPTHHLRNVNLNTNCGQHSGLYFGSLSKTSAYFLSRALLTNSFFLSEFSINFENSSTTCLASVNETSSPNEIESNSILSSISPSLVSEEMNDFFNSFHTSFVSSTDLTDDNFPSPNSTSYFTYNENPSISFINPTSSYFQMNPSDEYSSELPPTSTVLATAVDSKENNSGEVSFQHHFPSTICVSWSSSFCRWKDTALTTTQVLLHYNYTWRNGVSNSIYGKRISKDCGTMATYDLVYSEDSNNSDPSVSQSASYLFEQPEHGGRTCNCVDIYFDENCTDISRKFSLCGGVASHPRRLQVQWNSSNTLRNVSSVPIGSKELPFNLMCNDSLPYIEVTFLLSLNPCGGMVNQQNEGVEFSIRISSMPEEWIPLHIQNYLYPPKVDTGIKHIRGYTVNNYQVDYNSISNPSIRICNLSLNNSVQFRWLQNGVIQSVNQWILKNVQISFNGTTLLSDSFDTHLLNQIVWPNNHLRNVYFNTHTCDISGLYFESSIRFENFSNFITTICSTNVMEPFSRDKFESSSTLTPSSNSSISEMLSDISDFFPTTFKGSLEQTIQNSLSPTSTDYFTNTESSSVVSFMTLTSSNLSMNLNYMPSSELNPSPTDELPPNSISVGYLNYSEEIGDTILSEQTTVSSKQYASPSSSSISTTMQSNLHTSIEITSTSSIDSSTHPPNSKEEYLMETEEKLFDEIKSDKSLLNIFTNSNPAESVNLLLNFTSKKTENKALPAFLLGHITENLAGTEFTETVLDDVVDIATNILQDQEMTSSKSELTAAVTTLTSLDNLQLNYLPENYSYITPSIILKNSIVDLTTKQKNQVPVIDTSGSHSGPLRSLSLPRELLQQYDDAGNMPIRVISGVYKNITHIFTSGLSSNSSRLGPDIISSSLACGDEGCPTSALTLRSSNVTITFEHSAEVQEILKDTEWNVNCVFLDVYKNRNITLKTGNWSERGCTRNASLSSASVTVCDCNHLTNFAILLSPKPPAFSKPVELSLTVIGYIGVAVSLVAMGFTIFTFVALKPLRSMRNYIHINLCISLSIAQIIFVAGVDKTGPPDGDVPIHCQVMAVLIHYFFLVSFMWMLMEGVVLYVALVRVFVKHNNRYILAFTIISYGTPLVYMGFLTLPLGFSLNIKPHYYGYDRACFLSPDSGFTWALIAPFLAIFMANVGFFIMAARIMWHHQSKQTDKKKIENVKNWLKSAISLLIIMSLTWIMGVFVIEIDELAFLAYIYTIMVAFQGLFIFFIFVVFSKSARAAYKKYWKLKVSESKFLSKYFGESLNFSGTTSTFKMSFFQSSRENQYSSTLQRKISIEAENSTLTTRDGSVDMTVVIENESVTMCKPNSTYTTEKEASKDTSF